MSADGVIFFFSCLYILFSETQSGKKNPKREVEDILPEGFWVMSWPVVMPGRAAAQAMDREWSWLHPSALLIICNLFAFLNER